MALGLLAFSATANAQYAGVYNGLFSGPSDNGLFSVLIRDDNTGVAIFYDSIDETGGVVQDINIDPDGSFIFPLPEGDTATGQISANNFSGTYGAMGAGQFSGPRSPDTGFFAAHGGFYAGDIIGSGIVDGVNVTLDGKVYAIADALGQGILYAGGDVFLGSTSILFLEAGAPGQIDDNGNINVILINGSNVQGSIDLVTHTGSGTFTLFIQGQPQSGTWTLDRIEPLPAPSLDTDIDATAVTDISGDTVPDIAVLSQRNGKRPRVRYYSGANRKKFAQVAYLSSAWAGVAAATLADGNQDGVANDPAVAVLGRRISNDRLSVQVRLAAGGAEIGRINFLNNRWTPVDVVVIDDADGDGVSDDTAIGVLGLNPAQGSQKQTTLQVRRLSDGSVLREVYYNNNNWTPLAAGAVQRPGRSPLLAVLAEKNSSKEIRVQARVLSDGSLQRKTFLSAPWRGRDLAILKDTNGDSVFNDASYMVLAVNPGSGLNRVQVRGTGGTLVKNLLVMNDQWQARRILGSDDISGNLVEELGVLGNRISDGKARLELTDFDTEAITGNIFP
jgi:hypothetical protein